MNTVAKVKWTDALLMKVIEFNHYPVSYIHSTWLNELEHGSLMKSVSGMAKSKGLISDFLLKKLELSDSWDYEFNSQKKRVMLDNSEVLSRLPLYIGIVLHESSIRSIVKRSERVALEKKIGGEAYQFAVKKARFLSKHGQDIPHVLIDWDRLDRFKNFLILSGLQVMSSVYDDMPKAFLNRLYLKLPLIWKKHLSSRSNLSLSKESCSILLLKIHKELNRQWQHLLS